MIVSNCSNHYFNGARGDGRVRGMANGTLQYNIGVKTDAAILSIKNLLGSVASYKTAMMALGKVQESIRLGSELSNMSKQFGASVSDLFIMRRMFRDVGLDIHNVTMMSAQLNNALYNTNTDVFNKLGLSAEKLRNMGLVDQFKAIGAEINKIGNQSEKMKAITEIFGIRGTAALRFISNENGIGKIEEQFGETAKKMEKSAQALNDLSTAWDRFMDHVLVTLAASLASVLSKDNDDLFGRIKNVLAYTLSPGKEFEKGQQYLDNLRTPKDPKNYSEFYEPDWKDVKQQSGADLVQTLSNVAKYMGGAVRVWDDGTMAIYNRGKLFSAVYTRWGEMVPSTGKTFDTNDLMKPMGSLYDKIFGQEEQKSLFDILFGDTPKNKPEESLSGRTMQIDTDRYARVGAFVGGATGAAADQSAKQTAQNTSNMLKSINKMLVIFERDHTGFVATM